MKPYICTVIVVGTTYARNAFLDGQNPICTIGPGGDSDRFAITDGNQVWYRRPPT